MEVSTTTHSESVPAQKPKDLLNYHVSETIQIVNLVFICTIIDIFGIAANSVNILIFVKQGFGFSTNISLLGLTVADLCNILTGLWFNICMNPLLRSADTPFVPEDIQYLTGGVPAVCFSRISGWITVLLTAERCLGIALPLRVKQIITQRRTTVVVVLIFLVNMLAVSSEYRNFGLGWRFYPQKNMTLYGLVVIRSEKERDVVVYVFNAIIGYFSFLGVIVFTIILVVKLVQKSTWRSKATSANDKADSMSDRDKKTVKMIVLIAGVMIACYTPGTIFTLAMALVKEFSIMGFYRGTFLVCWSFGFIFQTLNSSVNIFIYYRMSTKYRQTFHQTFKRFQLEAAA